MIVNGGVYLSQDNKEKITQFCIELGKIVYETLECSKIFFNSCEDLLFIYRPKTREEVNEFCEIRYKLPDPVEILCSIREIDIPDDEKFFDSIESLRELTYDIAAHMLSTRVLIEDIINMHISQNDNDMQILQYLSIIKSVSLDIYDLSEKLDKLYKEKSQIWPGLLISDEDTDEDLAIDDEEETVLPGEVENFQSMRIIIDEAFTKYTNENKSEHIFDFIIAINKYLESFENGIEHEKIFDFGFALEAGNEIQYIDFNFESEMIQITSGGSTYDKYVGSDSYTNWIYSIWINGWDEEDYNCDFSEILDLIRAGAELRIEYPEEYSNYEEEE